MCIRSITVFVCQTPRCDVVFSATFLLHPSHRPLPVCRAPCLSSYAAAAAAVCIGMQLAYGRNGVVAISGAAYQWFSQWLDLHVTLAR